ncbi:MAG: dolichyl-phosphate beta-glucosyltransferase [Patescibacteria group bacterium]
MNGEVYLSVIIPAYNEGERILKTIDAISEYLSHRGFSSEIIVSSGGSTDNTVAVVRHKMLNTPRLRLVEDPRRGKGLGVKIGMLAAYGRIRLFTDADNSTDISHFDKMRPFFDQGYEVVIASRDPKDAPGARQAVSQAWHKRLMGNMGNLFIQLVAVRGFWDTQCGFKAFRDSAAEKIFGQQRVPGWGFDIEALALAKALGYRIGVIPAYWVNDPKSHVRLSTYFQVLWETVKVRLNFWRDKYEL